VREVRILVTLEESVREITFKGRSFYPSEYLDRKVIGNHKSEWRYTYYNRMLCLHLGYPEGSRLISDLDYIQAEQVPKAIIAFMQSVAEIPFIHNP
jgi:hypothetical protein